VSWNLWRINKEWLLEGGLLQPFTPLVAPLVATVFEVGVQVGLLIWSLLLLPFAPTAVVKSWFAMTSDVLLFPARAGTPQWETELQVAFDAASATLSDARQRSLSFGDWLQSVVDRFVAPLLRAVVVVPLRLARDYIVVPLIRGLVVWPIKTLYNYVLQPFGNIVGNVWHEIDRFGSQHQLLRWIPMLFDLIGRVLSLLTKLVLLLVLTIVAPWRSLQMLFKADSSLEEQYTLAALDYLTLLCLLLIVITLYKLPALYRALRDRRSDQSYSEAVRQVFEPEWTAVTQSMSQV
jgi:hypothetical protein